MTHPCQLGDQALRCVWGKSSEPKTFCMLTECALSPIGDHLAYDHIRRKVIGVSWMQHAALEDAEEAKS